MAEIDPSTACAAVFLTIAAMAVLRLIEIRRRLRTAVEIATLDLWRAGYDTAQIAATLRISEASATNALARARDRQRDAEVA